MDILTSFFSLFHKYFSFFIHNSRKLRCLKPDILKHKAKNHSAKFLSEWFFGYRSAVEVFCKQQKTQFAIPPCISMNWGRQEFSINIPPSQKFSCIFISSSVAFCKYQFTYFPFFECKILHGLYVFEPSNIKRNRFCSLFPILSVKRTVHYGLSNMVGIYVFITVKIGNRSCNAQYPVMPSGRKAETLKSIAHEI